MRLTADQWRAARIKWESDPTATFASIGEEIGVSKQAVSNRAKTEGWERTQDLADLSARAQIKADKRQLDRQLDASTVKPAVRELAENIRADVIERHRADWSEHRSHFTLSRISADFEVGKRAKISAEMLAIRQKGERAAYGLDEGEKQDDRSVIVNIKQF